MDRREAAIRLRKRGLSMQQIANELHASTSSVHAWVKHIRKPLTYARAARKGYKMGDSRDLVIGSLDVVAKEIRRNETIIACMSRLVAAMSQEETSQKERNQND